MDSQVTNWCASLSAKLRQRTVISAASKLSKRDKDLIFDALVMRTALLYDLLTLAGSSHTTYVVTCWKRTLLGLKTLDVELYASDWKMAREIVTSEEFLGSYPDAPACSRSFKQTATGLIHYKWIVNACIALIEDGGDRWYSYVNQFIVFDSKLNLTSLDLTAKCCQDYLDFEASTSTRENWRRILYGTDDGESARSQRRTLRLLRVVAEEMFGDFDITNYPFRPRHGNGATKEVERSTADSWHKNRQFLVDSEVITYLRYRDPEHDWRDWLFEPRRGLDRTSELVCVPKSMTSNRTISKEPTTLQFLQQDVFRALDDYFVEKLASHIDLHDQERSRQFAKAGSSDGSYATIDLSSASDSVTVAHIDYLFEGMPIWYPLVATRSDRVHVRSSRRGGIDCVISTNKFAPMGSATCFPVECAVFAIIAECAIRVTLGRRSRDDDYVVYGDDIVIRDDCFRTACAILHFLGFTVNGSKSFGGETTLTDVAPSAFFREACGIECLNGEDITPLKLSRRLVSLTNNDSDRLAGQGVGMVDLLNRTYIYGYTELRRWINSVLVAHKWYRTLVRISWSDYEAFASRVANHLPAWVRMAMPFVITDDLCDSQWRSYGFRNGWNVPRPACQLQRREARVTIVKSRLPRTPLVATDSRRKSWGVPHDSNDYYTWVLAQVSRAVDDDEVVIDDTGIVTIRATDLKWSQMWVPLN